MMGWASYDPSGGFACATKSVNIEAGNRVRLAHAGICKDVQNMRTRGRSREVNSARTAMLELIQCYFQG